MKNTTMLIGVAVLLVIGAGVFAFSTSTRSTNSKSTTMMADTSSSSESKAAMMDSADKTAMSDEKAMMDSADKTAVSDEKAMMDSADKTAMSDEKAMMGKKSNYLTFSSAAFASAANTRRVLFFYANWCPTCAAADKDFTAKSSTLPSDVTVIKVNYNDPETDAAEKELAKQYGVTYQHTFVEIDSEGKALQKWNGGEVSELVQRLQ